MTLFQSIIRSGRPRLPSESSPTPLAGAFLGEDLEATPARAREELENALEDLHAAGQAAWPAVNLPGFTLAESLGGAFDQDKDPNPEAWLRSLNPGDIFIATACKRQDPVAIAAFDACYLSQPLVGSFISRMRPTRAMVDELRQMLREKLFVGQNARIAQYSGRGALSAWLRVMAVRMAIDMKRQRPGEIAVAEAVEREPATEDGQPRDAEIGLIKDHYRVDFEHALREALSALSSEQRNVLNLHFIEGLTLEQVAKLLRVHRATAARWIASARGAILADVQQRLQERFGWRTDEFQSLVVLLGRDLEVSIARHLKPKD
jgi:RNA polymerase sigma-70 factor (ECF subfamily)